MFNYICGMVTETTENTVTLECGKIGYELYVTASALEMCANSSEVKLYCHFQVKDDGIALYGFSSRDEKALFEKLITVSGVGCKVAQSILKSIDCNTLALAIYSGDTAKLSHIKGLGKKTAERLILELGGKVNVNEIKGDFESPLKTQEMRNARDVLVSLGLAESDAEKRIETAAEFGGRTCEELLSLAFRMS